MGAKTATIKHQECHTAPGTKTDKQRAQTCPWAACRHLKKRTTSHVRNCIGAAMAQQARDCQEQQQKRTASSPKKDNNWSGNTDHATAHKALAIIPWNDTGGW